MKQLETFYQTHVFLFASPIYWNDHAERTAAFEKLRQALQDRWKMIPPQTIRWHLIDSDTPLHDITGREASLAVFVPMSGGVQPWMCRYAEEFQTICLLPAFKEDLAGLGHSMLHRNAHPSASDFFAHCQISGKSILWMYRSGQLPSIWNAWQATQRLRHARFLKIGETEPWVINSTREPARFAKRWGTEILPKSREDLYRIINTVPDNEARELADNWLGKASSLNDVTRDDIVKACRITAGMEKMLNQHDADGLSMACFSMIGDMDTTSCLALSALNDSANAIGACEGDLDAAVTLFLLKALGADFVWIANPIFDETGYIDLVHCTAPRCALHRSLDYRLLRHHESGRGVSPEVALPGNEQAVLTRIGAKLTAMAIHPGRTARTPKLPACHTQIRFYPDNPAPVLQSLLGTHFILSYGNWSNELKLCAQFLDLKINPDLSSLTLALEN